VSRRSFSWVDARLPDATNKLSWDAVEGCLMTYNRNRGDSHTEFSIEVLRAIRNHSDPVQ
jgi:hypothetical protein